MYVMENIEMNKMSYMFRGHKKVFNLELIRRVTVVYRAILVYELTV